MNIYSLSTTIQNRNFGSIQWKLSLFLLLEYILQKSRSWKHSQNSDNGLPSLLTTSFCLSVCCIQHVLLVFHRDVNRYVKLAFTQEFLWFPKRTQNSFFLIPTTKLGIQNIILHSIQINQLDLTGYLSSHTTKSVADLSFGASVPAIPNYNSSYIWKSVSINNCR